MQVFAKTIGYDYSAGKLGVKFGWYSQPTLVVESPFEIVHLAIPLSVNLVVFVLIYRVADFGYPHLPTA